MFGLEEALISVDPQWCVDKQESQIPCAHIGAVVFGERGGYYYHYYYHYFVFVSREPSPLEAIRLGRRCC